MTFDPRARANELAKQCMADINGPNDAIADDPTRWCEPLKSWSVDEFRAKLESTMLAFAREVLTQEPDEGMREAGLNVKRGRLVALIKRIKAGDKWDDAVGDVTVDEWSAMASVRAKSLEDAK